MKHMIVFMRDHGGDRSWLDAAPTVRHATVDGEAWTVVRLPGDQEAAFWTADRNTFEVRHVVRADTYAEAYDALEAGDMRDLWRALALARRNRTITVES